MFVMGDVFVPFRVYLGDPVQNVAEVDYFGSGGFYFPDDLLEGPVSAGSLCVRPELDQFRSGGLQCLNDPVKIRLAMLGGDDGDTCYVYAYVCHVYKIFGGAPAPTDLAHTMITESAGQSGGDQNRFFAPSAVYIFLDPAYFLPLFRNFLPLFNV